MTRVNCSHCTVSVTNDRVWSTGGMILAGKTEVVCFVCFHGSRAPSGPGPPHYRVFTIILRLTTLGRTPLDDWSAHRKDKQSKETAIQCTRRDPNPQSQQASGRRPTPSTVQPLESAEKSNTWSTRRKPVPVSTKNCTWTAMGKVKYLEYPEKNQSQCSRKIAHGLLWDRTQASTMRGRLLTIVWGLNLEICMEALRKAMISLSGQGGILQNTSAPDGWRT